MIGESSEEDSSSSSESMTMISVASFIIGDGERREMVVVVVVGDSEQTFKDVRKGLTRQVTSHNVTVTNLAQPSTQLPPIARLLHFKFKNEQQVSTEEF